MTVIKIATVSQIAHSTYLRLTARAALGAVHEVAATYYVAISNTTAGLMLLEPMG